MIDTTDNTIQTINGVVYHDGNEGRRFLLIQENDQSWGFPGGAKEVDDLSLEATLQRELHEELGLREQEYHIKKTPIVYEFEYTNSSSTRYGKRGIERLYLIELPAMPTITLPRDIINFGWFTEPEALSKLSSVKFYVYRSDLFKQALGSLGH